jgi:beta-galactosidase
MKYPTKGIGMNLRVLTILFCSLLSCAAPSIDATRLHLSLDFDWRFTLGDAPGADAQQYDDRNWRVLDLPHDWSVEGEFDEQNPSGYKGGFLPTGIGWYRKTLEWNNAWHGKRVRIEFDGVYMNADVWVNGQHLGHHPYGYIGFSYDLTPHLIQGRNTIAVRVDNEKVPSSRWYSGSGIYRHVWLTAVEPVHVDRWGTYVTTPKITAASASMQIRTDIVNETDESVSVTLENRVSDSDGLVVVIARSDQLIPVGQTVTVNQQCTVPNPRLWSPEDPAVYSVESVVLDDGNVRDTHTTITGIRTVEVSAERGFVLNGTPIKLKGLCNHHDAGPVGAAVPEDVLYRRLKLLKELGCNALRTAHHPFAPEFYAMCDTMGFLVMDEAFDGWNVPKADFDYGLYFDEWWEQDLEEFIKRDRNHPSVVIWSIGNEVKQFTNDMQKTLVDFVKRLDDTRPITQARGYRGPYIDIAGFNGHGEMKGRLEEFHTQNPDKPVIGTEMTHTLQTRGVYRTKTSYRLRDFPAPWEIDKSWNSLADDVFPIPDLSDTEVFADVPHVYHSSYDNCIVRIGVRDQWKRTRSFNWLLGTFRWTGFDYLGEATVLPARCGNKGIIDLAGFPKDHYYLYKSLWSDKPMVHLLPHWTHPGRDGVVFPVVAYTNCESAELFLNDQSLGAKKMTDELQIVWQVPYEPGILRVEARNGSNTSATMAYKTAGTPAAVAITPDRMSVRANRRDVVHLEIDIVDADGIPVPYADNLVTFALDGPARLIGVENGDIRDFNSMKAYSRKAFMGKCLLIVQTTDNAGIITVTVSSDGLISSEFKIPSTGGDYAE